MKYSDITFINTLDLQNLTADELKLLLRSFSLTDQQIEITLKQYKHLKPNDEIGFYNNKVYIKDCMAGDVTIIE